MRSNESQNRGSLAAGAKQQQARHEEALFTWTMTFLTEVGFSNWTPMNSSLNFVLDCQYDF